MTKLMKRLILLGVAMIAVLVGLKFFSTKQLKATLNTPIIELSASNEKIYAAGQKFYADEFTVKEKH